MNKQILIVFLLLLFLNKIQAQEIATLIENKNSKTIYFGLETPNEKSTLFEPKIFQDYLKTVPENVLPFHSSIIFTPDFSEAYWSPMLGGAGILYSKFENGYWTEPQKLELELKHGGLDPVLSTDGNKLYFLSREHPENQTRSKERIWFVERTQDGWSDAKPLTEKINSFSLHWTFSVAANGNLYFNSEGVIYCSTYDGKEYEVPKKLNPGINNNMNNSCPYIAPDESYLIFTRSLNSSDDLFISYRGKNGNWEESISLGEKINTKDAHEMTPRITPDGKYLFFLSKTEKAGMYWVNTSFISSLRD